MATVKDLVALIEGEVGNTSGQKYWDYCREHWYPWIGAYVNGSITPYCAAFVSWGLGVTGTKCEGFPSLQAFDQSWRANGRRIEAYDLQRGDVINFDWDGGGGDHVGYVEERLDAGYYQTIEGNAGGKVARCWRDASVILYGIRPYYETEDEVTDKDKKEIAEMAANLVVSKLGARNSNGITKVGEWVWGAKNVALETVDCYQILRDIRNALGIHDGQKIIETDEYNTGYDKSVIAKIASALGIKQ